MTRWDKHDHKWMAIARSGRFIRFKCDRCPAKRTGLIKTMDKQIIEQIDEEIRKNNNV